MLLVPTLGQIRSIQCPSLLVVVTAATCRCLAILKLCKGAKSRSQDATKIRGVLPARSYRVIGAMAGSSLIERLVSGCNTIGEEM